MHLKLVYLSFSIQHTDCKSERESCQFYLVSDIPLLYIALEAHIAAYFVIRILQKTCSAMVIVGIFKSLKLHKHQVCVVNKPV